MMQKVVILVAHLSLSKKNYCNYSAVAETINYRPRPVGFFSS